jgi:hypothetical protein
MIFKKKLNGLRHVTGIDQERCLNILLKVRQKREEEECPN